MSRSRWLALALAVLLLGSAWSPDLQEGETTEDPSNVVVTQLHIFMTSAGGSLQVGEYYLISNSGELTYVGSEDSETGQRVTLAFSLPEGATELSFDGPGLGERFLEQEGGFVDTEPVPPGTASSEVLFSYVLPYQEGFRVERAFEFDISSIVIVMPDEGLALDGSGIYPAGTLDTQAGPALSYTAGPLFAGDSFAFTLVAQSQRPLPPIASAGSSDATESTASSTGLSEFNELLIGLLALAGGAALIFYLWRSPNQGPLPSRARPLVEAIAALDDKFAAEQVSENTYRQKRKALMRQVRAVVREEESWEADDPSS